MIEASFAQLKMKLQYRTESKIKPWKIIGFDTETNIKINRVELIASETGDYSLVHSFEDLTAFFFQRKFRGKSLVFYNLKFDGQAIIKWISDYQCWSDLWYKGKTEFDGYKIELIPWKRLRLKKNKHVITLYDIAQFFTPLTLDNAAKKYLNKEKLKTVDRKALDFTDPLTIEYCVHDAKLAGDLARLVYKIHREIYPQSPFTLISKASISEKHFLRTCQIPTINNLIKYYPEFLRYAYECYKGGMFETYKKGYFPEVYNYDINSAYPYQIKTLPDLSKGRFLRLKNKPLTDAAMGWMKCTVEVDIKQRQAYYSPLAVDKRQCRFYPAGVFDCYMTLLEYRTLKEYFEITPVMGIYWIPDEPMKLIFADEINRLYHYKEIETDPVIKYFYKIVLNSLYGKTIQKIYNYETGFYETGNLFNPFFASYITAGTRMALFDAQNATTLDNLIMVATDSILSKKPLPDIELSDKLGDWSLDKTGEAIVIGCGVYSIKTSEKTHTRNRGFKPVSNVDFFKSCDMTVIDDKFLLPVKTHVSLARCLIRKQYEELNLIINENKALDINFDYKRYWLNSFTSISDLETEQIDSIPLLFDFL